MPNFDIVIAGGGIVGLSTAYRVLQKNPGCRLLLVEKETGLARHQTGRNSGVIHSGLYYAPGSAKALLCRSGYRQLVEFAAENGVAHEICGKVVVALDEGEMPRLDKLEDRARQNGLVGVERLDPQGLREVEPESRGLAALRVPETGIIDYKGFCARLADRIREQGGEIRLGERVVGLLGRAGQKRIRTTAGWVEAGFFVNCGGQYCDQIALLDGLEPGLRIAPFRGEYYAFKPGAPALVRHLIYPVPDPAFPFLGVHFTRMIEGGVECGPNAVLAFGREAYAKTDFHPVELAQTLAYSGFRALAKKHWRMGLGEMHRSVSKAAFVKALQRLVPAVTGEMLEPRAAGIRAQALKPDGGLVDDFHFVDGPGSLHVLNAPSPAATACLAIGEVVADKIGAAGTAGRRPEG